MKVNFKCNTDGSGYWSNDQRSVRIRELQINIHLVDFGELMVIFDKRTWDIKKNGLIYTDNKWMKEFRSELKKLGFSNKAVQDVDYSEQGMQGDDYVSMDVGVKFISEWKNLNV